MKAEHIAVAMKTAIIIRAVVPFEKLSLFLSSAANATVAEKKAEKITNTDEIKSEQK
jgi:hypothetical protein